MTYHSLHRLNRRHAGERQPRQDKPERRTIPCDKGMAINAGNGRHRWRLGVCEYCGRKRAQVVEYV